LISENYNDRFIRILAYIVLADSTAFLTLYSTCMTWDGCMCNRC